MKPAIFVLLSVSAAIAADSPETLITNGPVKATILLPDPGRGYYRGTRFDWSGVIASLEYKGHNYFGKWFEKYDPKLHDAIMGPVEEFRTNDSALGFDEAKPGDTFVKIGVGVLRKADNAPYKFSTYYDIVNGGKWTTSNTASEVRFKHELTDSSGYAYVYEKTIRLVKDKPRMIIEHRLKNTGNRSIETSVYDHNFFVIDGKSSGPDFTVTFPFPVQTVADVSKSAVVNGKQLTYVRELQAGESVYTELKGYGSTVGDYDIQVENTREKVGAHIVGDRPLSQLVFWSIRTTLCPEAYISMKIDPGKTSEWKMTYEFY